MRRVSPVLIVFALMLAPPLRAATPASGTLSAANPVVTWNGTDKPATGASCTGPSDPTCDHFGLTVVDPGYPIVVTITLQPGAGDWDLLLYDANGAEIDTSGEPPALPETISFASTGSYTVSAAPFVSNPATPYTGRAEMKVLATVPAAASAAPAPKFLTYAPPGLTEADPDFARYAPSRGDFAVGLGAGEPTLGVPWANNLKRQQQGQPNRSNVMFLAGLQTLRLELDRSSSPPLGTWRNKSCPRHAATLDPIVFVDPTTGRTISTQLNAKRSLMCLSGDDGDTWLDSPQGAGINAGVDHQTVGAGPYPASDTVRQPDPLDTSKPYPNATYYASQDVAMAQAALSRDGGLTWGPAVPMYSLAECDGLHGHVQVGPDGTVYVPNGSCPIGQSGVAISRDAGTTWSVHAIPGSVTADDPGIGIGRGDKTNGAGRVYLGACQNGRATVSHSENRGDTWSVLTDVGYSQGVKNCAFATMIAGDDDRAAMAFLGTTSDGGAPYGDDPTQFDGLWYLYVAVTYDGGATWVTSNASPGDPVQRGPICMDGTGCGGYRNLLDFNDIAIDERGRILVGYSDGCVGNCVDGGPNSLTAYTRVASQQQGTRGLLAQYDAELAPAAAQAPAAPWAEAERAEPARVELKWAAPFDGGSAVTGYKVFRRAKSGGSYGATPLFSASATARGYSDAAASGGEYCYRVQAVNSVGASAGAFEACEAPPLDVGTSCVGDGRLLGDDRSSETIDGTPLGLKRLFAGEPFLGDPTQCATPSPKKIEFNVRTGGRLAPGNALTIVWNRQNGSVPSQIVGAQAEDRVMVSVRMAGATPTCHYGHVTGSATTSPFPSFGYDVGNAFPTEDCVLRDDGVTVRLPVAAIDDCGLAGCPVKPGYTLVAVSARTFPSQPVATATTPQPVLATSAIDEVGGIHYVTLGNDACRPEFPPEANDDRIVSDMRKPTTFDALANDTNGGDCDTIRVSSATQGQYGSVAVAGDGRNITYTPRKKNACTDQFTYVVSDSRGHTDQAMVVVRSNKASCAE